MKQKCIVFIEASTTGAGEVACAYAKRAGLGVILMSREPGHYDERILKHCDIAIAVDTASALAVVKRVADIASDYAIAGVATTSGLHVVQAAVLAARLGLPGNRPRAVATMKNKFRMREAIGRIAPALNPAYALEYTFEGAYRFAKAVGFPVVVKPSTGNDRSYVRRVGDADALRTYFEACPHWAVDLSGQEFATGVLVEKAIGGTHYALELLRAVGGELLPIGAFSKRISGEEAGNFTKIGASFPACASDTERLVDAVAPVVDALGFEVGAIEIDCKIVDGQVKILEINPCLVDDQMGSHMIEVATGQNPAHAVVDVACGQPLRWVPTRNRGVAIHRLTMPRAGCFQGIANAEELKRCRGVEAINELGVKGCWIERVQPNQQVVGSVVVSHAYADEAMMLAIKLAAKADIRVECARA